MSRCYARSAAILCFPLVFSPAGVSASEPREKPAASDQFGNYVSRLVYSPDGKSLMIGGGHFMGPGEFAVLDLQTGKFKYRNKEHRLAVHGSAFSPDGKLLATGGGDGELNIWDAATGKQRASLVGHRDYVKRLQFTSDGKLLASASLSLIKVWDVATSKPLVTYRFPLTEKALESDFPETKEERAKLTVEIKDAVRDIYAIALSPDDKTLYASGGKDVRAWDLLTGKERPLKIKHDLATFALSPDGKTVFTGAGYEVDDVVKAWDVTTGETREFEKKHKKDAIVFLLVTPDGKTLVSDSNDGTAWAWDAATGKPKVSIDTTKQFSFSAIALSPDGRTVVGAMDQGTVLFFDVATGKPKEPPWEPKRPLTPP